MHAWMHSHTQVRAQVRRKFRELQELEGRLDREAWLGSPERQELVEAIHALMSQQPSLAVELVELGEDDLEWSEVGVRVW